MPMAIVNLNHWEEKALTKDKRREKKKRPKMKVSGAGVKQLQKLILKNSKS